MKDEDHFDLAIVVPAYNEEALIGQCLTAIAREVSRTDLPVEVVVVDNASTDRTAAIASSFEGVRVVREERKGLVVARAAGFRATGAELVANVDADTIMPEGWIERAVSEFSARPDLVALSGPFVYYDLTLFQRALVNLFYGATFIVYILSRFVLRIGSVVQGGNFVIRRSAWERVGGYDHSIAFYGEDTDVAVRLSRVGAVKWTFALPMWTSGRRLASEGIVRTAGNYVLNFFWVTFRRRPATKEYTDVRPESR